MTRKPRVRVPSIRRMRWMQRSQLFSTRSSLTRTRRRLEKVRMQLRWQRAVLDALLLQEKKLEMLVGLQEQSLVELTDSLSYRLTDSLPQPMVPLMLELPKELEPKELESEE